MLFVRSTELFERELILHIDMLDNNLIDFSKFIKLPSIKQSAFTINPVSPCVELPPQTPPLN